jgi:AcrR family transcriptional regulator
MTTPFQTGGLLSSTLADQRSVRKGPSVCKISGVVTFQRARSEEQRAIRRRAILDAAAAMLGEMPVAEITLNELSRRAGLAKSNVLRYFDSREAVLLELLEQACRQWLEALGPSLAIIRGTAVARREALAVVLASSLAGRPVLCDLLSAQAAVLERNVSAEVAAHFKRSLLDLGGIYAAAVAGVLPELPAERVEQFVAASMIFTGGAWSFCQPSAAMLAAYEAHPELAALRMDVESTLRDVFATLLSGLYSRG